MDRTGSALVLGWMVTLGGCTGPGDPGPTPKPILVDFNQAEVGKLAPGFTTDLTGGGGPVSWVVRDDPTTPGGSRCLIQESSDDTSYRFPLCVFDGVELQDVRVEARFKAIAGAVDQAAGVLLRWTPENYYVARANALEDNINLFKVENGKRVKIEEVSARVTPEAWHTLRFEARGDRLKVDFDGKTVIDREDTTFVRPGKVGLWTKADSVAAFDDFRVEPIR